jgi:hypothetical protein
MAKKIFIVLSRRDRLDDIVPYILNVARPGMTGVFLVPYPIDSRTYFRDHWIATESRAQAERAGKEIIRRYSWTVQTRLAQRKIAGAAETLRRAGIDVSVRLYSGSRTRAVKACKEKDESRIVMISAARAQLWNRLTGRFVALSGRQRARFAPVMLLHV